MKLFFLSFNSKISEVLGRKPLLWTADRCKNTHYPVRGKAFSGSCSGAALGEADTSTLIIQDYNRLCCLSPQRTKPLGSSPGISTLFTLLHRKHTSRLQDKTLRQAAT